MARQIAVRSNNEGILTISIFVIAASFMVGTSAKEKVIMKEDKVKIEIWSDVVCPFCYLGKEKLEKAIDKLNAEDKVEVIWHSFQLDPDFPKNTSVPSMKDLSERKGYPLQQVEAMCGQLADKGRSYGIDFQFDKALTFNTFDAHRLLQWSKTQNKSHELKEALLLAYFTKGDDLSKKENLRKVADKVGLAKAEGLKILLSNRYAEEVNYDIDRARKLGIQGVPYFLINESVSISGAQDDTVFENALSAALQDMAQNAFSNATGICIPNKECK